jgi:hypothetical protein
MHVCQEHGDALDFFSYVILFAPDFPIEDEMTLDRAFSNMQHGVDAARSRTTMADSLRELDLCREELHKARGLYESGEVLEAEKRLQAARERFRTSKV